MSTFAQARALLEQLAPSVATLSTPELVEAGADLWALSSLVKSALGTIKETLRKGAPPGSGQYQIEGQGGTTCLVTVQAPQPILSPQAQIETLRTLLGPDFDRLFDVTITVTPRRDFETLIGSLDRDKALQVLAQVEMVTHKPRVAFQEGERACRF